MTPGHRLASFAPKLRDDRRHRGFRDAQGAKVVRTIAELRQAVAAWRREGLSIALVPTMGALHLGHLALLRRAGSEADRTIGSIFVNPSQFAPSEDLARYPRDEAGDLAKLAAEGCHLVWAPTVADMYPDGFGTRIVPAGAALGLESDHRPHFFAGVATVCWELFTRRRPTSRCSAKRTISSCASCARWCATST